MLVHQQNVAVTYQQELISEEIIRSKLITSTLFIATQFERLNGDLNEDWPKLIVSRIWRVLEVRGNTGDMIQLEQGFVEQQTWSKKLLRFQKFFSFENASFKVLQTSKLEVPSLHARTFAGAAAACVIESFLSQNKTKDNLEISV